MEVSPVGIALAPWMILYAVLLFTAVVARAVVCFVIQSGQAPPGSRPLGQYDVAKLMGSSTHVVETALAGLVGSGAVALDPGSATEFRSRPRVQPSLDAVQRQVRDLLPGHPNGHRLTLAFNRSEAARQLRSELSSSGVLVARRPYAVVTSIVRAYFWIILPVVCVMPWTSSVDAGLGMLIITAFVHGVLAVVCHATMPLTLTRQGARLQNDIRRVLYKYNGEDLATSSATELQQTKAALSTLEAGWRFEPGLFDSPNGLVAFAGWGAYRDKWGQHVAPHKYWDVMAWPFSRTSGASRYIGLLYRAAGALCGLAAIQCVFLMFSDPSKLQAVGLMLGLAILPGAGARMTTLGKKHRVTRGFQSRGFQSKGLEAGGPGPTGYEARGFGRCRMAYRPPVLYLRSFTHDARLEEGLKRIRTALGFRSSYIEELDHVLHPFGDLVAIGNPGASLPGLGPAQIFVPPDTGSGASAGDVERWQAEVLALMQRSSLVVIAAGLGDGLLWEFQQATARVLPQKLVVLVPLGRADYALFRQHTGALFRAGLPADPRASKRREVGLIYFDHDWTPHFVRFVPHSFAQFHLGRIAVRPSLRELRNQITHAMYPVFHRNGAPWPGFEIPIPFARAARHRILRGLPLGRTTVIMVVLVLVGAVMSWS